MTNNEQCCRMCVVWFRISKDLSCGRDLRSIIPIRESLVYHSKSEEEEEEGVAVS